jgi:hypothetical protein
LYFEVGEEKLYDELDCVNMIKSMRQLRIMTQILLTKNQKFMIKFQRNNIIDSSSSGTSDEGQMNIIGIHQVFNFIYRTNIHSRFSIIGILISNIYSFDEGQITKIINN